MHCLVVVHSPRKSSKPHCAVLSLSAVCVARETWSDFRDAKSCLQKTVVKQFRAKCYGQENVVRRSAVRRGFPNWRVPYILGILYSPHIFRTLICCLPTNDGVVIVGRVDIRSHVVKRNMSSCLRGGYDACILFVTITYVTVQERRICLTAATVDRQNEKSHPTKLVRSHLVPNFHH